MGEGRVWEKGGDGRREGVGDGRVGERGEENKNTSDRLGTCDA